MKRSIVLRGLTLVVVFGVVAVAQAVPEPSPSPTSWELSLEPSAPTRISVDLGAGPKVYWYMVYTVTNNTGVDVDFQPEIVRVNEIESEVPADKAAAMPDKASKISVDPAIVGVHPKVYDAIKRRHAKTHPFLVEPVKAITRLLQGRDNAVTSVAVFPDLDPKVSKFTIFFAGLSGERIIKPNPAYDAKKPSGGAKAGDDDEESNPRNFVLRKTLAMPFTLPGDERTRRAATPKLGRMNWVMR